MFWDTQPKSANVAIATPTRLPFARSPPHCLSGAPNGSEHHRSIGSAWLSEPQHDLQAAQERTSPSGARCLELDGLADTVRRLLRRQVNSATPVPSAAPALDWWGDVASSCNRYLEVDCWGPPPWSALQWSVLVGVAQMAVEELGNLKESG
jgi:hypothetical protein